MNAVVDFQQEKAQDSTALMALINRVAVSPDYDVAKLEKLLELKERWDAEEARKMFVSAMAAFKSEPIQILKTKFVNILGGAKFAHATLADVVDAACAAMGRHGLSHKWETKQEGAKITVTCILSHELGHSESTSLFAEPDNTGNKNSIQAVGSTVTYLQRYTLLALTGMATTDQDTDGRITPAQAEQMGPAISEKQEAELQDYADALRQCDSEAQLKGVFADAYKYAGTVSARAKSEMTRVYNECKARLK